MAILEEYKSLYTPLVLANPRCSLNLDTYTQKFLIIHGRNVDVRI